MENFNYDNVSKKVEEVLKENFVIAPPVKIEDIASNYELIIVEADFGKDAKNVAGFIDPEEKKIYVNKNDSDTRQAFTIAHELGHWLLHRDQLVKEPDKYAILYRIPLGKINGDPIEKEANFFAANLLVPRDLLKKYRDYDINTIARIFGVSSEVIGYRLKDEYGGPQRLSSS